MREYNLEPSVFKKGPKGPTGPKQTKFKELILGKKADQFNKDDFIAESKNGLKIDELMSKYNLTLYQIRELRKKYELKRR